MLEMKIVSARYKTRSVEPSNMLHMSVFLIENQSLAAPNRTSLWSNRTLLHQRSWIFFHMAIATVPTSSSNIQPQKRRWPRDPKMHPAFSAPENVKSQGKQQRSNSSLQLSPPHWYHIKRVPSSIEMTQYDMIATSTVWAVFLLTIMLVKCVFGNPRLI